MKVATSANLQAIIFSELITHGMKTKSKIEDLQNFLFLLFVAILPFNIRHIFNFSSIDQVEGFREHISLSIYIFDILLVILFFLQAIFWMIEFSQSIRQGLIRSYKAFFVHNLKRLLMNPFFYFLVFIITSIFLSDYAGISFYNGIRLIGASLAFLIASKKILASKKIKQIAILIVFLSGILQSLIAIMQFSIQKSIGLKIFGESVILPNMLGVAKFEFAGLNFIRSYGTLPHPNLLAAFLLLALACGFWFLLNRKKTKETLGIVGIASGIVTIFVGIFLSYSRSAIAISAIFLVFLIFTNKTWFAEKFIEVCRKIAVHKFFHGALAIILIFIILFGIYNLLLPRICFHNCPADNSISLRIAYTKQAFLIIREHPIWGIGPGTFVEYIKEHFPKTLQPWEFQPVHNIYLIASSELGLLGFIGFLSIIAIEISKKRKSADLFRNPISLIFLLFLLLGMTDHYFWTLPQGRYIFWLSLAFFSRSGKISL